MAVVKADGFGHGAVRVASTALSSGATWLGVTTCAEALQLRAGGITAPILSWLHSPLEDFGPALLADVDLSVSTREHLRAVAASAAGLGVTAEVHLKADTGLHRNGARPEEWRELVRLARDLETTGHVRVRGVWSHLVSGTAAETTTRSQVTRFDEAVEVARVAGLRPELRHLANSAATLGAPRDPLRARPSRHRALRGGAGPAAGLRAARRHDVARAPDPRQAGAGRQRRVLRARLRHRPRHHARAGAPGLRGRSALGRGQARRGLDRRPQASGGRPDRDGPVRRRRRRRRPPDRRRGRRVRTRYRRESRRWPTGPGGRTPSHTRSSPASAPGWPATTPIPRSRRVSEPKIRLAVLFGGRSGEHEVSCESAASILAGLDRERYEVLPVRIGRDGVWASVPTMPDLPTVEEVLRWQQNGFPETGDTTPAGSILAAAQRAHARVTWCSRRCTAPTGRTAPSRRCWRDSRSRTSATASRPAR